MASHSRWAEKRAERLLAEWRTDRWLRTDRRKLRAESRQAFADRVTAIQDALAVLERELCSPDCIIGDGTARRKASRGLLTCKTLLDATIAEYSYLLTPRR